MHIPIVGVNSPTRSRTAALLVLLLLAATTAFVGGLAPASPAGAQEVSDPVEVVEGDLVWGLRASFRGYAGGSVVGDGATHAEEGNVASPMVWPLETGTYDEATGRTELQFGGWAHFKGHCEPPDLEWCALDMRIANPRLVISPEESSLYLDVLSREYGGDKEIVSYPGALFAVMSTRSVAPTVADGRTTWSEIPSVLSEAGYPAFAGFYAVGAQLDPVSFEYVGPGGRPVSADDWAEPGELVFEQHRVDAALPYVDVLAIDDERDLVHLGGFAYPDPDNTNITGSRFAAVSLHDGSVVADTTTTQYTIDGWTAGRPTFNYVEYLPASNSFVALKRAGALGHNVYEVTLPEGADEYSVEHFGLLPGDIVSNHWSSAVHPTERSFRWTQVGEGVGGTDVHVTEAFGAEGGPTSEREDVPFGRSRLQAIAEDGSLVLASAARQLEVASRQDGEWVKQPIEGATDIGPGFGTDQNGHFYTGKTWVAHGPAGSIYAVTSAGQLVVVELDGEGGGAVVGEPGPAVGTPTHLAVDRSTGRAYITTDNGRTVVVEDGAVVAEIATPWAYYVQTAVTDDGTFVIGRMDASYETRLDFYTPVGSTPSVLAEPEAVTVTIEPGVGSVEHAFSVAAAGEPAPAVQWQSAPVGTDLFADIEGATGEVLELTLRPDDDGRQFRAVLANEHGAVPSEAAVATVRFSPRVLVAPLDRSTTEGDDARFEVFGVANPEPEVTWQRYAGGFWWNIGPDDDGLVVDGGFLTVTDTNVDQSGTRFRARLRNEVGTAYTRAATLGVAERNTDPQHVVGGDLEWGVRASFRNYIVGQVANGEIAVEPPATRVEAGTFSFPAAAGTVADQAVEAGFDGAVRFTGHVGHGTPPGVPALDMRISDVRIEVDGQDGTLVADVVSRGLADGELTTYDDVPFADLDLSGASPTSVEGGLRWADVPATLTAEGVPAFADFYPAGDPLDPVSFTLLLSDEAPEPVEPRTATESFVTAALVDFLGAEPAEAQVAVGVAQVQGSGKAAFLRSSTTSDEWLEAIVDGLYRDTLGRPADSVGAEFWVGRLRSGWTVARVAASFYAALEYYDGIGGGTDQAWVGDLYQRILGRSADADGLDYWVGEAQAKGRGSVALRLYQSDESARVRVRGLYEDLLGRSPEPGGLAFWALRVVDQGDLALAVSLAHSDEYQARAEARYP